MLVRSQLSVGLTRSSTRGPCSPLYFVLREQVNNVRMAMSPLWRGLGNANGFLLDGTSNQQGYTTAQTPNEPAVSGARIAAAGV